MNIKQYPAHTNNYGVGRAGKTINKVVLHWIVGTLESADATFANPDRKASAHYGIGDNEIHQYVKEQDTAWHASNLTVNRESVGIEHEGGWLLSDGTRFKPTDETHKTSAELVADICKRYNIPLDREHIRIHKEFSATQCPGSLDVDRIIEMAKAINAVPTPPPATKPITDATKINLGADIGIMEVQAIRSNILDSRRDIEVYKKSVSTLVLEKLELEEKIKELESQPSDEPVFKNKLANYLYQIAKALEG